MIFFKSIDQQHKETRLRYAKEACGVRKYAWFPKWLDDGRLVWLDYYWITRGAFMSADRGIEFDPRITSLSPQTFHRLSNECRVEILKIIKEANADNED